MDQSPPKRVTRARAAAKTTDTGIKTTKIATAASKAKVTRAVSTTKRKTRADDVEDEEQQDPEPIIEPEPQPKTTRGRAKKAVQPDPEPEPEMNEPPIKPTRGRPKKAAAPVETPAPEPARATRGRAKKIEVPGEDAIVVEEPAKRPTRARATTVSKPPVPKKTVKFEEPDKENIVPIEANAKGKAKAAEPATGLRAKPVRKPAATTTATTTTRATRGRAKSAVEEKPKEKSSPLSPKKATQVATAKEPVSEDELATTEKTPMKPLMKNPMKPPGSVFGTAKKLDFSTSNAITVNRVVTQDLKGSIIASPARRPPQSPFKETFKATATKLTMGNSMLQSPFKPSLPAPKAATENSPFKASLLQSPARRPQSPTKVGENGSPSRSTNNAALFAGTPKASTFKISRFATPRTITKSAVRSGQMLPPSMKAATGSPASKDDSDATMMVAGPSLSFSGRLSSIMPREVDPAFEKSEPIVEESAALTITQVDQVDEPMAVDESDTIDVDDPRDHNTTPPTSPPRNSTGYSAAFALRETEDTPFDDSESEDELASGSPSYSPVPMPVFSIPNDFASSPATPSPFKAIAKTPKTNSTRRSFESARKNKIGFTPLARQLSDWMAASPENSDDNDSDEPTSPTELIAQRDQDATPRPSPAKSSFFEDEMSIRDELAAEPEVAVENDLLDANFEPVELDEEDMALAFEADEMSMLEPEEVEAYDHQEMFEQAEEFGEEALQTAVEEFLVSEPVMSELEVEQESAQRLEPTPAFETVQAENAEPEVMPEAEVVQDKFDSFEPEIIQEDEITTLKENVEPEMVQESDIDELAGEVEMPSAPEPAPSEASQEYGDENAMPIDPQLMATPTPQSPVRSFATPKPRRALGERVCHTVSKVPLKAAADDTPIRPSPMKRSASISRLPSQRPSSTLSRNNTVISYSPTKSTPRSQSKKQSQDIVMQGTLATPSKIEGWSTMGTPARTPRRDINSALLKGAVVFVDVHTSEGSDASALFTELLTQMGARCVKTWNWNGSSEDTSKIGITHVVFKDGGKRTLERAKETNGVVSCVGVGWVLDCERENKWLDESAYSVDTDMVPRGGQRRRKSMEPRALAKMNGELVSSMTPNRNASSTKEFLHFPDTPVTVKSRRRESVQWVRSPASSSGELDDQTLILSPVPATPEPETIFAYSEDGLYGEDTPVGQTPYFLHNKQLVQKTAPAARRYVDTEQFDGDGQRVSMGAGFLSEKKDDTVMARLMAVRRKSMQFAPKVGSPLARGSLF